MEHNYKTHRNKIAPVWLVLIITSASLQISVKGRIKHHSGTNRKIGKHHSKSARKGEMHIKERILQYSGDSSSGNGGFGNSQGGPIASFNNGPAGSNSFNDYFNGGNSSNFGSAGGSSGSFNSTPTGVIGRNSSIRVFIWGVLSEVGKQKRTFEIFWKLKFCKILGCRVEFWRYWQ